MAERIKKETDGCHPMYRQLLPPKRCRSFLNSYEPLSVLSLEERIRLWQEEFPSTEFLKKESHPTGNDLLYIL